MKELVMALGLMAVIEGLVFALAPLRFEELLKVMSEMPLQQKRTLGLAILAVGVFVIWVAKTLL